MHYSVCNHTTDFGDILYCGAFQSAILTAIKALFLQLLWSFQVNIFSNPSHPSSVFVTLSIFSLGIMTQRPGSLLLNKIARTVLGFSYPTGNKCLETKHKVVSSHRQYTEEGSSAQSDKRGSED